MNEQVVLITGATDGLGKHIARDLAARQAKILFTITLAEQLGGTGVTVNALHPATFMDTNMVREADLSPSSAVDEGAEAVAYLATSGELDGVTGQYFDGKRQAQADPQAYDPQVREHLWRLSERLRELK